MQILSDCHSWLDYQGSGRTMFHTTKKYRNYILTMGQRCGAVGSIAWNLCLTETVLCRVCIYFIYKTHLTQHLFTEMLNKVLYTVHEKKRKTVHLLLLWAAKAIAYMQPDSYTEIIHTHIANACWLFRCSWDWGTVDRSCVMDLKFLFFSLNTKYIFSVRGKIVRAQRYPKVTAAFRHGIAANGHHSSTIFSNQLLI